MNSPDWNELGLAFDELSALGAMERASSLEQIKIRDEHFFAELSSLLAAHDAAGDFIEKKVEGIFQSMLPELVGPAQKVDLNVGELILHFEIMEQLGEGSIAKVYLARDLDLDRLVALKVTLNQSKEARTLAHFSSDGIVQVYSEHITEREGLMLRLLCLQFIPGPTLQSLSRHLTLEAGPSLLSLLEAGNHRGTAFDPSALKWRELLSSLDVPEGIVLLGIKLAEILQHAHEAGVLHLDIKPANILIDPYGRPFLSDFNVSTYTERIEKGDLQGLGGTPHYMAPEQARLFDSGSVADLDARSDVFALGTVLSEMLAKMSFKNSDLDKIMAQTTAPEREQRTISAWQLRRELSAWLRSHLAEKEMPRIWWGFGWISLYPMWAAISLTVASQLVASVINISYNQLQIVSALTERQKQIFFTTVGIYNVVVYPLIVLAVALALKPLSPKSSDVVRARKTTLRVPLVMFLAISFGWLPGAWIFPKVIELFAGPVGAPIYWQFALSFSLAWLISLTTSIALNMFVLARVLYPRHWRGESSLAQRELHYCERLNRLLTFASALVPLFGVLLMVATAPMEYSLNDYHSFKVLLLVTVGFGLLNLLFVQRLSQVVSIAFAALKQPRPFA